MTGATGSAGSCTNARARCTTQKRAHTMFSHLVRSLIVVTSVTWLGCGVDSVSTADDDGADAAQEATSHAASTSAAEPKLESAPTLSVRRYPQCLTTVCHSELDCALVCDPIAVQTNSVGCGYVGPFDSVEHCFYE